MYQITMAYSYWKNKQHNQRAIFDIFFRKNPFGGEFTVFAGLEECLTFLQGFSYSPEDIDFFRSVLPPTAEDEFFDYMAGVSADGIKLYSVAEGTIVFPKEPLMRIEGPLAICQLLETSLLTLVNFPRYFQHLINTVLYIFFIVASWRQMPLGTALLSTIVIFDCTSLAFAELKDPMVDYQVSKRFLIKCTLLITKS